MIEYIDSFSGKYKFLSNYYYVLIKYDGLTYPSTEHAFQASKTLDINERIYMSLMESFSEVKRYGNKLSLRDDWETIKLNVMEEILRIKFLNTSNELKEKLLNTGEAILIEGNTWGDKYWGVCNGEGENHLGKLLMKIRSEIL